LNQPFVGCIYAILTRLFRGRYIFLCCRHQRNK